MVQALWTPRFDSSPAAASAPVARAAAGHGPSGLVVAVTLDVVAEADPRPCRWVRWSSSRPGRQRGRGHGGPDERKWEDVGHLTVQQGQRAVVRRDGRVSAVLGPGRHRLAGRRSRRHVDVLDVRAQLVVLTGQEVAAADVPGVRVSASARWSVDDPVAHLEVSAVPLEELRLAVQLAVRDWVAARPLADVLAGRAQAAAALTPAVAAEVARLGIVVAEVAVRDVSVPGELRRALLATATASQEGLAALERARGEVAATRALANAARTLADSPALLQLRTVQAAAAGDGQLVLHLGGPRTGVAADDAR